MRPLVVSYWHCCLLYCQNLRAFFAEVRYYTDGQFLVLLGNGTGILTIQGGHYPIGLIVFSIKAISSSERLYFR